MEKTTLSFIIEEIMKAFVSFGLAFETVVTYQKSLSKMQYYFKQVGSEYYSEVLLDDYWYYVNHNGKAYSPRYLRLHKRSIALVKEYVAIGKLTWHRFCQEHGHSVFSYFQLTIDESVVKLGIPKGTLKFYISTVRQFCCKLEENGIFEFSQMNLDVVFKIITSFGFTNPHSMGKVVCNLKKFFGYLNERNLSDLQIEPALFRIIKKVKKIPAFTLHEVQSLLSECNRNLLIGKRNYAIILLAVTSGLRGGDIAALKLTDINWHKYEITIVQNKTKKVIVLPLLAETGNAIADYILNARPKSTVCENIFLTINAPIRPLRILALDSMLPRLCQKANVNKAEWQNFHSLRRSTGTWMANTGTPVTTIAQVLGHSDFQSANRYISADPNMVLCSLNFTGIPVTSEVYR